MRKPKLRNDGTPHQAPLPSPWYRARMTRSIHTIHSEMAKDLYRQIDRHYAGRWCWNPALYHALIEIEGKPT